MFRSGSYLFGIKERDPGYRYSTGEYDISQVILVTRGTLRFSRGEYSEEIGPRSFCFLAPGSSFTLSCSSEGYRGLAFEVWEQESPGLPPVSQVHQADKRMQHLASWAEEEYRNVQPMDSRILLEICRLMYLTARSIHTAGLSSSVTRVEKYHTFRARQLLKAHASDNRSVSSILETLPISYRHLSRYFKQETGLTPKQFRTICRMELAKEYLEQTNLNTSAIASELGFASSQHFSRAFLQHEGISPGNYRSQRQEKRKKPV